MPTFFGATRTLRRNAIGKGIRMESAVRSKGKPTALILVRFCDVVHIVGGKVLPRVVPNNGQKSPRGTFEMLHQHRSGRSVAGTIWRRRQYLLQILAVTRCGPKDYDHVHRYTHIAHGV